MDDGGAHVIVACPFPAIAAGVRGADGVVDGTTWFDVPAGPFPAMVVATTRNT